MQYGPCHELESVSNVISIQLTGCLVYLINVPGCICTCELDLNRKLKVNRWLSSVYEKHCISKEKKNATFRFVQKNIYLINISDIREIDLSQISYLACIKNYQHLYPKKIIDEEYAFGFQMSYSIQIYCVMILFHNTFIHRVMNRSKRNE